MPIREFFQTSDPADALDFAAIRKRLDEALERAFAVPEFMLRAAEVQADPPRVSAETRIFLSHEYQVCACEPAVAVAAAQLRAVRGPAMRERALAKLRRRIENPRSSFLNP